MKIHGKEYTEVKERISEFLKDYSNGMINTQVIWQNEDFSKVCFRAVIYPDATSKERWFSGTAYEEREAGNTAVNATSWVENCETSAIGRALANMNIGVNGQRPSAEEMKKVQRMNKSDGFDELYTSLDYIDSHDNLLLWGASNREKAAKLLPPQKIKLTKKYKEVESKLTKEQ